MCTVPYFGFKAKRIGYIVGGVIDVYCALFWIQGKTDPSLTATGL